MRTTLQITLLPLEVRCVHYYTVHWYYLRHDAYHITSISAQYMRKRRANDLNYLAATMAISKSTRLPLSLAQARKRRPASDEPNGRGYAAFACEDTFLDLQIVIFPWVVTELNSWEANPTTGFDDVMERSVHLLVSYEFLSRIYFFK